MHEHVLPFSLLKPVNFPMADIFIEIRKCRRAPSNISPPFSFLICPIERQGRCKRQAKPVSDGNGVDLMVDIERKDCFAGVGVGGQTRDAVVLFVVDGSDGNGVFEKRRVCHYKAGLLQ